MKKLVVVVLCLMWLSPLTFGQSKPAAAGHWEGVIGLPNKQLQVTVDLAQNGKGEWTGSLGLPDLNISDFALSKIVVKPDSVLIDTSEMLSEFSGPLSSDGTTISGEWACALLRAVPVSMQLKRVGDAALTPQSMSAPISREFEGTWEGAVKFGETWESDDPLAGSTVRFRVRLARAPDGTATGALTKLAEPKVELPFSWVEQKGTSLRFEVRSAGTAYSGELAGDELRGEWRQFGSDPVAAVLKRVGAN
jgi:hypothetical protein